MARKAARAYNTYALRSTDGKWSIIIIIRESAENFPNEKNFKKAGGKGKPEKYKSPQYRFDETHRAGVLLKLFFVFFFKLQTIFICYESKNLHANN